MLTETEIAAMKERDSEVLSNSAVRYKPDLSTSELDRHTLLLEREELLKEKERLDWLENQNFRPEDMISLLSEVNIRAVIDAAIAKEKK